MNGHIKYSVSVSAEMQVLVLNLFSKKKWYRSIPIAIALNLTGLK